MSQPVRNILITGSSRGGLGLEFVHQYLCEPNTHVIATVRNLAKATALQELKQKHSNLTLVEVDVSSPESVRTALASLPPLSLLINNAGVLLLPSADGISTATDMSTTFNTNVTGTLLTIQAALPALERAVTEHHIRPVVVNISSNVASIQAVLDGTFKGLANLGYASYFVSKTAVNMLTAIAAQEHPDITFISLHPGWVDTDMGRSAGGGATPTFTPTQSVSSLRSIISAVKPSQSGYFFNYDGTPMKF